MSAFAYLSLDWKEETQKGNKAVYASNLLSLLRLRNGARFLLRLWFGQEAEAGLAPGEVDADIEQRVGSSAGAGEVHHGEDDIGLAGLQRHRPARHMVRRGIDAKNEIAGSDCVAHGFHPVGLIVRE